MLRLAPVGRAKHPRKGETCGVGQRKVRARTLGADGMSTLSGSGRAQANKYRQLQVFRANKQQLEAPARSLPITQNPSGRWRLTQDPSSGERQERNRRTAAQAGQPPSLGPNGRPQLGICHTHNQVCRPRRRQ
eukprot:79835-Chlamydomonas_euryale.AAC.1